MTHSLNEKLAFSGKRSVQNDNALPATAQATLIWSQSYFGEELKKIPVGTELEFSVRASADEQYLPMDALPLSLLLQYYNNHPDQSTRFFRPHRANA